MSNDNQLTLRRLPNFASMIFMFCDFCPSSTATCLVFALDMRSAFLSAAFLSLLFVTVAANKSAQSAKMSSSSANCVRQVHACVTTESTEKR